MTARFLTIIAQLLLSFVGAPAMACEIKGAFSFNEEQALAAEVLIPDFGIPIEFAGEALNPETNSCEQPATVKTSERNPLVGFVSESSTAPGGNLAKPSKRQAKQIRTHFTALIKAASHRAVCLAKLFSQKNTNRHPDIQDAQQERTKTVWFLQAEAGID